MVWLILENAAQYLLSGEMTSPCKIPSIFGITSRDMSLVDKSQVTNLLEMDTM